MNIQSGKSSFRDSADSSHDTSVHVNPGLDDVEELLLGADLAAQTENFAEALRLLRNLPLSKYGELFLDIPSNFSALRRWLPSMPDHEIQNHWTGSSGHELLKQSCDFVRSLTNGYDNCTNGNGSLMNARVLDYGCGWGRISRLMSRYTDPENIYCVDANNEAIEMCKRDGVWGHYSLCDYIPTQLPFERYFDLIYAFSVFTHLSKKAADSVLRVISRHLTNHGLLAITLRPVEFWDALTRFEAGYSAERLKRSHKETGFAYMPKFVSVDGHLVYGETSMTLDFINSRWPEWKILGTWLNGSDPLQKIVFLQRSSQDTTAPGSS